MLDVPHERTWIVTHQIYDHEELFFKLYLVGVHGRMGQSRIHVHVLHVWDLRVFYWFAAHFVFVVVCSDILNGLL